jgi:hypothetical protein
MVKVTEFEYDGGGVGDVTVTAGRHVLKNSSTNPPQFESKAGSVTITATTGDIRGEMYDDGEAGPSIVVKAKKDIQLRSGQDIVNVVADATTGSLTADGKRAVTHVVGTAKQNVWVAARGKDLSGSFEAKDGWAYAWAYTDLIGTVAAKQIVDATARNNLDAELKSSDDGVRAFAGQDILKPIDGAYWVEATANRHIDTPVTAGAADKWASAVLKSGGSVKQ